MLLCILALLNLTSLADGGPIGRPVIYETKLGALDTQRGLHYDQIELLNYAHTETEAHTYLYVITK